MLHQFQTKAHDLPGLFQDVQLMSTLMKNIEKQAVLDPTHYEPNDYRGDAFEFFVELFLSLHSADNRVGVYDYVPIKRHEDRGADGRGINIRKEKCVVQIKYRNNTSSMLSANEDHLSNLMTAGMLLGVSFDMEDPKNFRHFVFTTAKSLHFYTDEQMFEGKVKCFGIENFRSMVDNNLVFWDKCREIVQHIISTEKAKTL